MENGLWWKMTFDGRQPLMQDDLWWKMTFNGRQPLLEDNLQWKPICDGRRHLIEDNLDERRFFMEDNLWSNMTFDGRRLSRKYNLWWKTNFYEGQQKKIEKENNLRGRANAKSVSSHGLPICSIRRSIRRGISRTMLVIWKSHSSTGPRLEGAGPPWQNLYSQPCKVLFNIKHSYHFHKMHEKV